jgi:hypothetical protein
MVKLAQSGLQPEPSAIITTSAISSARGHSSVPTQANSLCLGGRESFAAIGIGSQTTKLGRKQDKTGEMNRPTLHGHDNDQSLNTYEDRQIAPHKTRFSSYFWWANRLGK